MTNANELERDVSRLTKRRAALQADLDKARDTLTAAREALVDGDGSAQAVTNAQADFTALQEALNDLEGRIGAQQRAQEEALAQEQREAGVDELLHIANTATKHRATYEKALDEAVQTLTPFLEAMSNALDRMGLERERFIKLGTTLECGLAKNYERGLTYTPLERERKEAAEALLEELRGRGADLATVLNPLGTTYAESAFDRLRPLPVPEPLGYGILEALAGFRRQQKGTR